MTILIFIFLRVGRNFSQLSGLITFHTLVSRFFAGVAEISASLSQFCAYWQLFSHPKHLAEISANLQFLLCINITPYNPIKLLSSHSVNVLWYYYNCHARMGVPRIATVLCVHSLFCILLAEISAKVALCGPQIPNDTHFWPKLRPASRQPGFEQWFHIQCRAGRNFGYGIPSFVSRRRFWAILG